MQKIDLEYFHITRKNFETLGVQSGGENFLKLFQHVNHNFDWIPGIRPEDKRDHSLFNLSFELRISDDLYWIRFQFEICLLIILAYLKLLNYTFSKKLSRS